MTKKELNAKLLLLLKNSKNSPLAILESLLAIEDRIVKSIQEIVTPGPVGPQGGRGEDGKDGVPGKPGESVKGDRGDMGPAGRDGPKGDKGDVGEKGKDGKNGKDGKDGRDGRDGIDSRDGKDGKDGSPDTGEDIVNKINSLRPDSKHQIDASHIKGLSQIVVGSEGRKRIKPGSNVATDTFTTTGGEQIITLTYTPILIIVVDVNGQVLNLSAGDYSLSGKELTILNANIPAGVFGKVAYTY